MSDCFMYVHNPEAISASNTEMEISEESASTSRIPSSVMALSQSSEFQLDSSSFTFKKEFDVNGYDVNGFNKDGYHKDGYEHNGCGIRNKKDGYRYKYIDRRFDKNGCDKDGNRYLVRSPRDNFVDYLKGYNYDKDGYNVKGFNQKGLCRDGSRYDKEGYDSGGYDRDGYNRRGFNVKGLRRDGSEYDNTGYDNNGYDEGGFDKDGIDWNGYDI